MARTTILFYTNCRDPARAQELSDWYDRIHIPDVVAVPGFRSCSRHRLMREPFGTPSADSGVAATYLSIVEADVDAETAKANLARAVADWHSRGRMSDLFQVVWSEILEQENPTQPG
jgi:hypothetical protein